MTLAKVLVRAIDQDATHAPLVAHFTKGDLLAALRALFRLGPQRDLNQSADCLSARRFVFLLLTPFVDQSFTPGRPSRDTSPDLPVLDFDPMLGPAGLIRPVSML
jgi:hypothetical protein